MAFSGAFVKPFRPAFDAGLAAAGNGLLNNLVAYWPLNEAGGANDALDIHGGHTAAQQGSPASAAGKLSTARTLNGSNQAFVATGLGAISAFSIAFWFSCGSFATTTRKWIGIKDSDDTDLGWIGQGNTLANNRYDFGINATGGNPIAEIPTNWHFWVLATDGSSGILYLDAVAVGSPLSASVAISDATIAIGRRAWASSGYAQGTIDEVGFWSRSLSTVDIIALYNFGAGLPYAAFTT